MSSSATESFKLEVPLADELPLREIPDIPFFSENYCFTGYDPAQRIGYYVHLGRWIKAPDLWRELLIITLPDGSNLFAHGFGRGDCSRGPAAGCLQLICEEPGKRIRIRFNGPMQHVGADQIAKTLSAPSQLDHVDLDVVFEGNSPYWYYGESDNTTWARWHTEQRGHARGTFRHEGRSLPFDGVAYRDHSRGARELSGFRGHTWIQGQFPEGDSFAIYQVWHLQDGQDHEALSEAKIYRDGTFIPARIISCPRARSTRDASGDFDIVLESTLGQSTIHCQPQTLYFFSYGLYFSHIQSGIPLGDRHFQISNIEQPAKFILDGRVAHGQVERSFYRGDTEAVFYPETLPAVKNNQSARASA